MSSMICLDYENYNVKEEYLYNKIYLFVLGYATAGKYINTLKALPLARKIHDGQYRKGLKIKNGKKVKVPYFIHCLKVCDTLISLDMPLSHEELDILYSSALLHDCLEDRPEYFPAGGKELIDIYGFPKEVYEAVKLVSKNKSMSDDEMYRYFDYIKKNKLALLVKIADRSNNVEDLYNIKDVHNYIEETRQYFVFKGGLCSYATSHYPDISSSVKIIKSKIMSLINTVEVMLELMEQK